MAKPIIKENNEIINQVEEALEDLKKGKYKVHKSK